MRNTLKIIIFSTLFFLVLPVVGNSAEQNEEYLKRAWGKLASMSGKFTATTYNAKDKQIDKAEGDFIVALPGKYKVEFTYGFDKGLIIVGDGKKVIHYDPDLESIQRYTPESFLLNEPLSSIFYIPIEKNPHFSIVSSIEINERIELNLVPKEKRTFVSNGKITFKNYLLTSLEVFYSSGDRTIFRFSLDKPTKTINDDTFKFSYPDDIGNQF